MALRGAGGEQAREHAVDAEGRRVLLEHAALMPVIPPRDERESRRIELMAYTVTGVTRWFELVVDSG